MHVSIGDCLEPTTGTYPPATYRVVGTGGPIVLLRLTDADSNRQHTGEISHVDRDTLEAEFVRTDSPDTSVVYRVQRTVQSLPMILRVNANRLASNLVETVASLTVVVIGFLIPSVIDLSETLGTGLVFLGILGLTVSMSVWYNYDVKGDPPRL